MHYIVDPLLTTLYEALWRLHFNIYELCCLQGRRQRSSFEDPLLRSSAANAGYGAAGPSAGAVPQAFGGFDLERENSSMGFTLAADLLGMPSLHGEYNAKVRVPCSPHHVSGATRSAKVPLRQYQRVP